MENIEFFIKNFIIELFLSDFRNAILNFAIFFKVKKKHLKYYIFKK